MVGFRSRLHCELTKTLPLTKTEVRALTLLRVPSVANNKAKSSEHTRFCRPNARQHAKHIKYLTSIGQ
jgi:hypothetical protein